MHVYISAQLCVCDCVCVSVSPWGHSTAAQHEARKVRGGGIGIHQDAPAAWNYIRSLGLTYRKLVYVFSNCRARRNRIEAIRCNHLPWESRNVVVECRCFGYLITRECLKVFFHHALTFFLPHPGESSSLFHGYGHGENYMARISLEAETIKKDRRIGGGVR